MAKAGRPVGSTQDKTWADALRVAVSETDETGKRKKLRALADVVVAKALGGDMMAAKEIGDRLDGKPAQTIAGDPNNPLQLIGKLAWQPPSAKS